MANLVTKKSNGLYHIKRTTSYEEKGIDYNLVNPPTKREKIKYIVECPVCGMEWKYKRKGDVVKFPGLYVCTKCDANLRLKNIGVNAIM